MEFLWEGLLADDRCMVETDGRGRRRHGGGRRVQWGSSSAGRAPCGWGCGCRVGGRLPRRSVAWGSRSQALGFVILSYLI